MRAGTNSISTNTAAVAEVEGAAETVVAVLKAVNTDVGRERVLLVGQAFWTAAATSENMTLRIRRGETTAGPEVVKATTNSVVSRPNECSIQGSDEPGQVAGQAYCLTLQESKAAAKDTAVAVSLSATY